MNSLISSNPDKLAVQSGLAYNFESYIGLAAHEIYLHNVTAYRMLCSDFASDGDSGPTY